MAHNSVLFRGIKLVLTHNPETQNSPHLRWPKMTFYLHLLAHVPPSHAAPINLAYQYTWHSPNRFSALQPMEFFSSSLLPAHLFRACSSITYFTSPIQTNFSFSLFWPIIPIKYFPKYVSHTCLSVSRKSIQFIQHCGLDTAYTKRICQANAALYENSIHVNTRIIVPVVRCGPQVKILIYNHTWKEVIDLKLKRWWKDWEWQQLQFKASRRTTEKKVLHEY